MSWWRHPHTMLAGILAGMSMSQHVIWIAAGCLVTGFVVGAAGGRIYRLLIRAGATITRHLA
jgi:hypothetical protein